MAPSTKTYVAKPTDRERNWLLVDANGLTLGRVATQIADMLRGKRKPEYTPHIDTGDFVVVVNAEKIHVTGNKRADKRYYRHSGYPGGLRSRTFEEMLARRPEEILRLAVKGMMPRNRLARKQLTKLKIYAGPEHPHVAQKPQPLDVGVDHGPTVDARSRSRRPREGDRMMADDESTEPQTPDAAAEGAEPATPDAAAEGAEPAAEGAEQPQHAVPSEEAREIAGSAEDAALEAAQEAIDAGGEMSPEPATAEPGGEGHAVPSEEALEIAGVAEDAALEAAQEAADETAVEAAVDEEEDEGDDADVAATGAKPSVPGAHLEVDIVPEGADPLGREQGYEDPYALEGEESEAAAEGEAADEGEEALTEPIATAAIDLAAGARYRATGKRKTAIARVTLRPGKGTYLINGRTLEQHFPRDTLRRNIRQPLETVGYQDRMDVVARLHGGGISAQAGALRHGVSRALLEADPNLRGELKRRGFLTRDSRAKERKKAGLKKARKRPQFSKR